MAPVEGWEVLAESPVYFGIMACLAVLAVAISKSGFGGALGSLSVPLMLFVLPPRLALGILLPLFLVTDVWVVYLWRQWLDRRILLVMCSFGLLGQVIGWSLLDVFNDQILTTLIGVIALITAVKYGWRRLHPSPQTSEEIAEVVKRRLIPRGAFWCGLSGISSFVSLSGGIPAQIFLLPHALARQVFVGTLSVYFFVINLAKLPFYAEADLFTSETWHLSLWLLPVIPVGVFLGKWMNTHLSDRIFYDISHSVLLVMGGKLLYSVL